MTGGMWKGVKGIEKKVEGDEQIYRSRDFLLSARVTLKKGRSGCRAGIGGELMELIEDGKGGLGGKLGIRQGKPSVLRILDISQMGGLEKEHQNK